MGKKGGLNLSPLNRLRLLAARAFAQACRDGHNDAVATAMAVQAALDQMPGLSIPEAYELVMETLCAGEEG